MQPKQVTTYGLLEVVVITLYIVSGLHYEDRLVLQSQVLILGLVSNRVPLFVPSRKRVVKL